MIGRTQPRASQHGLTLMELVIAIGLLGVISVFTWTALAGASDLGEESKARSSINRMGRNATDIIRKEISQAFISQNQTEYFKTVFKGTDRDPVDEVYFVARAHEKRYADTRDSDLAEYGYESTSDLHGGNFRSLLHREAAIIDDDPEQGGTVLALAHSVRSLNLRYYDEKKEKWLDDWDSESTDQLNRVPDAIEIRLELEDDEGRTAHFFTRTPVLP